jgi:TetR/AcrR family transcriptional regulator
MATSKKGTRKATPKSAKPERKTAPARRATTATVVGMAPRAGATDGDTERRILDAARRVFTRRGSAGARMQEIAEEAGVNQALLHYYFRTKDQLSLAVFREAAGRLFPGVMRIMASEATLEARIEQVVHHYIDTLRANPFLPGYVIGELNFDPSRMTALATGMADSAGPPGMGRPQMLARLDAELARRVALGEFRPITADQFLVNLASLCVFPFAARPMVAAMFGFDGGTWDDFLDARRRELPAYILNALRA